MKTIIVFSTLTFILIFGVIVLLSELLPPPAVVQPAVSALSTADAEAMERAFRDLEQERERVQQEREQAMALRLQSEAEKLLIEEAASGLEQLVADLRGQRAELAAERERAAVRVAKVYEAMKPESAAPILATLDLEVTIEIMGRMKERQAARILARMDTALAARISERLSLKETG